MPSYRCVVATPTSELFSGDIYYANIPGTEGNYGVLANHEQYVGMNRPGVLTLTLDEAGNETVSFAIYNGMSQMFNNHLSILAQLGRPVDEIDVDEAPFRPERRGDVAVRRGVLEVVAEDVP